MEIQVLKWLYSCMKSHSRIGMIAALGACFASMGAVEYDWSWTNAYTWVASPGTFIIPIR